MSDQEVIIVSGLPRSGTSMMMKMLDAGGISPLTDTIREADTDNPEGYYEFERVKALDKGDKEWIANAPGKAVKVISMLLRHLPEGYHYKVIFMRRDIDEILRSQRKMMERRGTANNKVNDAEMGALFRAHIRQIEGWLAKQPHFEVIYINYNEMLSNPTDQAESVNEFLGSQLDIEKMVGVVNPTLYRNRKPSP